MSAAENPDREELTRLLNTAKPLLEPMYPDQLKAWVADSPLAQEISALLAKHPEYYDEINSHIAGAFEKPKAAGA